MVADAVMEVLEYTKHEAISLAKHPVYTEKWVQDRIADDPSILGLGDLDLRDVERKQPRAGRLDLLLRNPESGRRYEVELMLGKLDESHLVRALEYWDIERRRFPQYEHCAVVVAEDVTSRFLNVIQLLNRTVPFIAIQMQAIEVDGKLLLNFVKVLDEFEVGAVEDDEQPEVPADRAYWEQRTSTDIVALVDRSIELISECDGDVSIKYNQQYIGMTIDGIVANFVYFAPRKKWLLVSAKTGDPDRWNAALDEVGLPLFSRGSASRFRVTGRQFDEHGDLLQAVFKAAYESAGLGQPSSNVAEPDEGESP